MTEYNEIRAVSYPVIIAGHTETRYGIFEVYFINGAPAHAELPRIIGLKKAGNGFLIQMRRIQLATMLPVLTCTNAVNLDDPASDWNGELIFDHLPVLE